MTSGGQQSEGGDFVDPLTMSVAATYSPVWGMPLRRQILRRKQKAFLSILQEFLHQRGDRWTERADRLPGLGVVEFE